MKIKWIDAIEAKQAQEFFDLYSKEWWTEGRQFDDVMQMLENSDLFIGCLASDGSLIGFARVLSDFTYKALIFDVIVSTDYRGQGIGKQIIHRIINHKSLHKVSSFELYCPDNMIPFYQSLGFDKGISNILFKTR